MNFIQFIAKYEEQTYLDIVRVLSNEFIARLDYLAETYHITNGTGELPTSPIEKEHFIIKCFSCGNAFKTYNSSDKVCNNCLPF